MRQKTRQVSGWPMLFAAVQARKAALEAVPIDPVQRRRTKRRRVNHSVLRIFASV